MNSLPAWVSTRDLDAEHFYMPSVPRGRGAELRAAAAEHRDGMEPARPDQRLAILRELRLGTVARNESEVEARASFAKLNDDLRDVPADILKAACRAYINEPGTRFFPRGAGEIRAFTNPLMTQRAVRARRLSDMAKASDDEFDEESRCSPEDAAAIVAEFGLRNEASATPRPVGNLRKPTREDYIALGVDPSVLDRLPGKAA
jgi:hypothetical protein